MIKQKEKIGYNEFVNELGLFPNGAREISKACSLVSDKVIENFAKENNVEVEEINNNKILFVKLMEHTMVPRNLIDIRLETYLAKKEFENALIENSSESIDQLSEQVIKVEKMAVSSIKKHKYLAGSRVREENPENAKEVRDELLKLCLKDKDNTK